MKNVKNALAKPASGASQPWAIWIWNRNITRPEIEKQLESLISRGFGGIAVRPGRDMSPVYMSQEFLDNFGVVLEIARQHKIGVRLADDFSLIWSGGLDSVIAQSRKLRAEYLVLERDFCAAPGDLELEVALDPECEYMAQTLKRTAKGSQAVEVKQVAVPADKGVFRWKAPSADWRLLLYKKEPAVGPTGCGIPNVLNSKVVQNYIQDTLEVIKTTFSKYVPTTFEGFITEMPALRPGGGAVYWDEDIAVKYKSRYKREFFPLLPSLFVELPGAERVRAQLYAFVCDLMVEKFAAALETWAKKYRLSQWMLWPETGAYRPDGALCDGYVPVQPGVTSFGLQCADGGAESFALMRAAADINSNQHRREVVTVLGRNRTGAGYGLQDLKRELDLSLLAGPSRILIDGIYFNTEQRNSHKTPFNPSWYSPEWDYMKLLCGYAARVREMTTGLQTSREVAVLSPYEAIMGDYAPGAPAPAAGGLVRFKKTIDALCLFGKSFDIVTEELLLTCSVRQNGEFATADRIRKGNYQALVVPHAPYVSRRLLVYLERLAIKGTPLIFIDEAPKGTYEDGGSANVLARIQKLVAPRRENVAVVPAADIEAALANLKPEILLMRESGEGAGLGVQVFHGEGGKLYMLHNVLDNTEQTVIAEVQNEKHFAAVDCVTGDVTELEPFEAEKSTARLRLTFSPQQTMFIVASPARMPMGPPREFNPFALPMRSYRIIFKEQWDFEPLGPNVLPLSIWNMRMGLSRESGQISHFYEASFEVKELPGPCTLVTSGMSRSAAPLRGMEVSFNGVRIDGGATAAPSGENSPWRDSLPLRALDRDAQRFEIGDRMIKGINRVSIRTTGSAVNPQTLVYPPFIVGAFSVAKGGYGLAIEKTGITAGHDSWTNHGYPYLSGRARYTQIFEVPNDYTKLVLRFSNVSGTAYVKINDAEVGILHWPPMELDVTKFCNVQRNKLEVEVVNTIDNVVRLNGRAPSGLRGEVYIDVYKT